MENLRFKCKVCGEVVEMKKEVKAPFCDWSYDYCIEWSDLNSDVPALTEKHWERSSETPIAGEKRIVFVQKPFDEKIGNEFWVKFEPALLFFNGWDESPEDEIWKCAMVRCRFEKIIVSDEFFAWIEVSVIKVIPLHDIYKHYNEFITDEPIDSFKGNWSTDVIFQNDKWYVLGWSAQGDCGETRWIYKDENGKRHLVLTLKFGFDEEVLYRGNIISSEDIVRTKKIEGV